MVNSINVYIFRHIFPQRSLFINQSIKLFILKAQNIHARASEQKLHVFRQTLVNRIQVRPSLYIWQVIELRSCCTVCLATQQH